MSDLRPIVGITMGDPVGIGPEIVFLALGSPSLYNVCRPLVLGDLQILQTAKKTTGSTVRLESVDDPDSGGYANGCIDVLNLSNLDPDKIAWGKPTVLSGRAMVDYITAGIDMATCGQIAAVVTCPINKKAMQKAGFSYHGHTELLAERTQSHDFAMMLAGSKLRVVLVTIHTALKNVPAILSGEIILQKIRLTGRSLYTRFGIEHPRIAVAALNPHAGEEGLFGDEEETIIRPAIELARTEGFDVSGPFPPDTIFYQTIKGHYDAVVCMYHDQGLIPFKMIHFTDGVNTTLGLPIIRTSVDHGTAYEIAGSGKADPGSLIAAIDMAAKQAAWEAKRGGV